MEGLFGLKGDAGSWKIRCNDILKFSRSGIMMDIASSDYQLLGKFIEHSS